VGPDAEGEAHFPPVDPDEWREISRERGERGPRDGADFAFVNYQRRQV
jgi:dihydrofolate reductase